MTLLEELLRGARELVPFGITVAVTAIALYLLGWWLDRRAAAGRTPLLRRQLLMLGAGLAALVAVLVAAPLPSELRAQLLGLLGILLSIAVTLGSTTFVGNAVAGLMLRGERAFRAGDFLEVNGHFGRVAERGLFHVQLQTRDRDLVNLPNLYLATHPYTVVRESGTIVRADVSLGYDVPHAEVERALLAAAEAAGLESPFVQVAELGDFSVTYTAAGLLRDPRRLFTARSVLRREMLDALHGAGIEIVSPSFMNQRVYPPERRFVPRAAPPPAPGTDDDFPEELVFDKADEAASLERLEELRGRVAARIEELRDQAKKAPRGDERDRLDARVATLEERLERIEAALAERRGDGSGSA